MLILRVYHHIFKNTPSTDFIHHKFMAEHYMTSNHDERSVWGNINMTS